MAMIKCVKQQSYSRDMEEIKEIAKYMKYQKVKEILENRAPKPKTKEMNGQLVFEL